ncbi:MAG: hypothetical protein AB1531_00165 [Chloroflexota bacterium]
MPKNTPEMTAVDVLDLLRLLNQNGLEVVLAGNCSLSKEVTL